MTDLSEGPEGPARTPWARAKAIFGAALEHEPHERRAFVDAACGSDAALRHEVASLLAAHESAGAFLERGPAQADDARPSTPASDPRHDDENVEHDIPLLSGPLAGRYTIQRELGRGGMATVYLATDARHPRSVAVKVLRRAVAAPLGGARFLREIRMTAALVHPHILPLYDSGEADGVLFYVMPYVDGETLRAHLTRVGRLSLDEALRIGREVADALAYAHAHGVVHRDIKPENILLSDGHAVVADFGIGHAAGDTLTGTGVALGTPAYMSPEQALGARTLDGRSDLYSLGCVLYEMLAGQPPFRADTARAVMAQHQMAVPPLVRTVRGDVPPAVEQVLSIALAKDPAERFASGRELGDALARAQGTDPGATPVVRRDPRRWFSVPKIVAALITFLSLATLMWWVRHPKGAFPTGGATLIAVAPFHVASASPELQHWKYDLPSLVAPRLDAARPLRALSLTAAVGPQPEITDRATAVALGRRTGSQFVVFGQVLGGRQGAVRVDAEVVDVAQDAVVDAMQTSVATPADAADRALAEMSDALTQALLTSFGASVPVAASRHAAFGCASSSWPAVMKYLRGEQFFRRTQWDSAVVAYEGAIALDSGCALAYHRIAAALSWQRSDDDSLVFAYRLKAGMHNYGLPPRDSLLVTADSLWAAVHDAKDAPAVPASVYWADVQRLLATLDAAGRQYPGDPEIWYALGDARYHYGWGPASTTAADVLSAFDNAIRQDSGFALAYLHPIALAFGDGGRERAMPYIAGYLASNPAGMHAVAVRLVATLTDPNTAATASTVQQLGTDSLDVLLTARALVARWSDSTEAGTRLSRVIAQRSGVDTLRVARCRGGFAPAIELARRLAYRGHLHEAVCALGDSVGHRGNDVFVELASLGALPDDVVAPVYDGWLRTGYRLREYALPWWAAHHDSVHLDAFIHRADSVLQTTSADMVRREEAGYDIAAGRAYRALVRGDTTDALAQFTALPSTQCFGCFDFNRLTEAELLIARDSVAAADGILQEWRGPYPVPTDVRTLFEHARIAERRGDREAALAAYRTVGELWSHADPVLQPMVAAAKRAIARLAAQ